MPSLTPQNVNDLGKDEEEAIVALTVAVLGISQDNVPAKVAKVVTNAKGRVEYRDHQNGTARHQEARHQNGKEGIVQSCG